MNNMSDQDLLRKYRKKPLVNIPEWKRVPGFIKLEYGRTEIERIIPHREPFLLIDRLLGLDLSEGNETILGSRFISESDPIFQGHFPDFPLYPGSLQLEMAGQLGLCLTYFVINRQTSIAKDARPMPVRATGVSGALYTNPLLPGSEAVLVSKKLEYDGYFGKVISQVISANKVCSVSIAEVIFLEG
jgi:3-hydroxyacyl-[acyl-carrier-protein] dehydratase